MSRLSTRDKRRPYTWYHTIWGDTMYHKVDVFDVTSVICKPQIIYLKHISFHWKKLSGKSTKKKKINDTPPHCCNRNDVCRNIKHQQSLPKNEQNTATTKLLLTCYGVNKQWHRDAVTTEMIPGPCIRELGIKFDYGRITGFAIMLQYHHQI